MKKILLILFLLFVGNCSFAIVDYGAGVNSANIAANLPGSVVTLTPKTYIGTKSYTVTTGVMEIVATTDSYYYSYSTNLALQSESLSSTPHVKGTGTTITSTTMDVQGVVCSLVTMNNGYSLIQEKFASYNYYPFVSGNYYFISAYVMGTENRFVGTRYTFDYTIAREYGHGCRYVSPSGNRIWSIQQATSTYNLFLHPLWKTNSNIPINPIIFQNNYGSQGTGSTNAVCNLYLGGVQIEPVPGNNWKQGVLVMGDSTMSSDSRDGVMQRNVSRWAEGIQNNNWFSRATAGFRTDQTIAAWSLYQDSVATWAAEIKYMVVQGGINDIDQGIATATITANFQTLYNLGVGAGYIPIVLTITPIGEVTASVKNVKRVAVNDWIIATFPKVIDIATYMASPTGNWDCRPEWKTDAFHHNVAGKEAYGRYLAASPLFELVTPSIYVKTTTLPLSNFAVTGNALVSTNIGSFVIQNQSITNKAQFLYNSTSDPAIDGAGVPIAPGAVYNSVDLGYKLSSGDKLKFISDGTTTINITVFN